ncbi:hypothetical protein, partial [Neisseria iguanae]|uniref:hypothetical protein n=1 Tax=Neisseria iguanae TaxID=90242 RepID=UPI001FE6A528
FGDALKNSFSRPSVESAQQGICFVQRGRNAFPRYAGPYAVAYASYFPVQVFLVAENEIVSGFERYPSVNRV